MKINYTNILNKNMINVFKDVLLNIQKNGLQEDHHLYITFDTNNKNIKIPKWLKEKFIKEMTIVIQYEYWNLKIKRHFIRALMVNTKNANTYTGVKGAQGLKEIAGALAKALTIKLSQSPKGASEIIKITDLLFSSTGVIGEDFPHTKIKNAIPELVKKLKKQLLILR